MWSLKKSYFYLKQTFFHLTWSHHLFVFSDDWIKFDDDNVSPVLSEDVLKLSGGGDWHCAYVLLYGPRRLEEPPKLKNQCPKTKLKR